MSSTVPGEISHPVRLTSLDQFRGYTMLGMLLVNFLGSYQICPRILKHSNNYCSYADTIMPQFLFAAGFALRLSLGRRRETSGKMPWGRAVRRIAGLAMIAVVWYSICDFSEIVVAFRKQPLGDIMIDLAKRRWFQTLLHIAATSLWILPVIGASAKIRLLYAIGSALLHVAVSWWFNFQWVNSSPSGIDGGPLGFLAWSVPALCGTLACDAVRKLGPGAMVRLVACGIGLMLLGWGLSNGTTLYNLRSDLLPVTSKFAADPVIPTAERLRAWDGTMVELPFVPPPDERHRQWNYWMMCQRCSSLSYVTFCAGSSLFLFALFLWVCDGLRWQWGLFRTLGTNSLAAYLIHDVAGWVISPNIPRDSTSSPFVVAGLLAFILVVYASCRLLERLGWYLRV